MKKAFWVGVIVIVSMSFGLVFFAPITDVYKGMASIPGVGGLVAALFQLVRDNAQHQRNLEIQQGQQLFNLGATSHMANTVFDKHVEFCEKYLAEVHQLVITLTREGPTREALEHAGNLYTLRIEYTAWITPQIEEKLMPFEKAVRNIGANSGLVEALSGSENRDETRSKAIEQMFDEFSNLMNIGEPNIKNAESTVVEVKKRVREILQINQLIDVREFLVSNAANVAANKLLNRDS
ncbi:hypothetical protein INR79_16720 [Vibrio sp. SCSIO 43132]|uniref:hypothetical protein n=1 Tax=Vibrio sp. SCSIO 43132 TaxID=2779363 RepID=UPI001CA81B15|nr:hypothetical protein [Vibrio sp. SCSIO 43132]UAB70119.1 hypothetical protein INR79_16720 [Vibrio sp. SCSIO 43132]